MHGAQAKVVPVAGPELERMALEEASLEVLDLQRFGAYPTKEDAYVVVVTGLFKGEPFRLWFVSQTPIESGREIELLEHQAAQLTVGEPPYTFVSNRVALRLQVEPDGTGTVEGKAAHGELEGRSVLRFEGVFTLGSAPSSPSPAREQATSSLGPRTDYLPQVLPYTYQNQSPPSGYTVRKSPDATRLVAGGVIFALSYGLPLLIAVGENFPGYSPWLAAPVVGPTGFLIQYTAENDHVYGFISFFAMAAGTTFLSAAQAAGLIVFASGFFVPRHSWVLEPAADRKAEPSFRLRFLPVAAHSDFGFSVGGTF